MEKSTKTICVWLVVLVVFCVLAYVLGSNIGSRPEKLVIIEETPMPIAASIGEGKVISVEDDVDPPHKIIKIAERFGPPPDCPPPSVLTLHFDPNSPPGRTVPHKGDRVVVYYLKEGKTYTPVGFATVDEDNQWESGEQNNNESQTKTRK